MTPAQERERLKPCPFDGGEAYMAHWHDEDGLRWSAIRCKTCGAQTQGKWHAKGDDCPIYYAEVRDEWQARAALDTAPAGAK